MNRLKTGQSTLEYMLVLAGVIAVIIWAAVTFLKPQVQDTLDKAASGIDLAANQVSRLNPAQTAP